MYVLKACKHAPNVFTIYRNTDSHYSTDPVTVDMICKAASDIYTSPQKPVTRSISLMVFEFSTEVTAIETCVSDKFDNKPLIFPFKDCSQGILQNVKIPSRYGHVCIPLSDETGSQITTFDIKEGMLLNVRLQAKTAWVTQTHCGVSWVLHSIKTMSL